VFPEDRARVVAPIAGRLLDYARKGGS